MTLHLRKFLHMGKNGSIQGVPDCSGTHLAPKGWSSAPAPSGKERRMYMSHFYGMISRSARKTTPTARAHVSSGLETVAASWQGAVQVNLGHNTETGKDWFRVELIPWHGTGVYKTLATGTVDGSQSRNWAEGAVDG